MNAWKCWLNTLSIRRKLIVYIYLTLIPILLCISSIIFYMDYRAAVTQEKEVCFRDVQGVAEAMKTIQNTMLEYGTYITINTEINHILVEKEPDILNKDGQLWLHHAPMQMLDDMLAINGQIKTIAIYPENGINPYLRCMDFASYQPFAEVKKTESYQLAKVSRGSYHWLRVGKGKSEIYDFNRTEKIVLYREIYDMSKKNPLGYLVIGATVSEFDQITNNGLRNEKEGIIVVTSEGKIMSQSGNESFKQQNEIDKILAKVQNNQKSFTFREREYIAYGYVVKETGLTVCKFVPKTEVRKLVGSALLRPLLLLFGIMFGLLPVLAIISEIISKPLITLCKAMREFKKGDFSQRVEVHSQDEIGEVSASFNTMVGDMKTLIDENYVYALRKKESELDILQAQINPHFLYNALDSLYWQVLETGNEKSAEDILELSDLFRLALNQGKGHVTVAMECELLAHYLHIQKMRFGERLNYEFKISDDIKEERIPKLILQPFVENAVVHGFEKGKSEFLLTIEARIQDDNMLFMIKDTGVGMSPEQLAALFQEEDTRKYAGQRIGHFAIKNVKERLEILYRDAYQMNIRSDKDHGTEIILQLPYKARMK